MTGEQGTGAAGPLPAGHGAGPPQKPVAGIKDDGGRMPFGGLIYPLLMVLFAVEFVRDPHLAYMTGAVTFLAMFAGNYRKLRHAHAAGCVLAMTTLVLLCVGGVPL